MKVISLDTEKKFEEACQELSLKVLENYTPDLVIGILTGGGFVGRKIHAKIINEGFESAYWEGRIQRKLTIKKEKSFARGILTKLPRWLTDLLIISEVLYLEWRSKFNIPARSFDNDIFDRIEEILISKAIKKVLIVDDCIDTGMTVKTIVEQVSMKFPDIVFKTAVICVTHRKPLIQADYLLFNRTICRFPWSMEVKQKK